MPPRSGATASTSRKDPDLEGLRERILQSALGLVRKLGHKRFRVTDVASDLGFSHANVYRVFASRDELLGAVVQRWLEETDRRMGRVAAQPKPASERLVDFAVELHRIKKDKVTKDAEIFAALHALAEDRRPVVDEHLAFLQALVEGLIAEGAMEGEFKVKDPGRAAQAFRASLASLHDPRILRTAVPKDGARRAEEIARLVLAGFKAGVV